YTDGTALLTATAINNTSPNIGWDIAVEFGARTTLAEVAPKGHNCLAADVNDYYFYETLEGKLTGLNDAAGASMNITRIGSAFQLGIAANITHKFFDFGGSGWFVADMLTQPTNGLSLVLNEGAQGQNGDININLSGDGTECIDGRDNSELDCANVSAIATADGITISGLTAPIEIVKVFDTNWVPVDDCTGDCGDGMTVAAAPGNYIVRVNFYTANWVGECEVDIPVTVPASANSASSRTAPRISLNTFEENRAITLEWLTNTGYKNEAYVIEKSANGFDFEVIQEQGNQEKSNELTYYKGVDTNPTLGLNYYRVKQIYADGSFDYSNIKGITFNLDLTALTVFPNPAQEEVFVNLKNYAGKTANIQITNAYGQLVQQVAIDNIPTQAIRLDASNFQNGLYHLSIRVGNSNVVTKKVLVNRQY
ncbi:MAG: T9SS type A sorting domain-containing protein, partial [Saprospiraceae bacterium]